MLQFGMEAFSPAAASQNTLVIFGCNGVLADGERIAAEVAADAFTEAGMPIDAAAYFKAFSGWSIEDVCRHCEDRSGRPFPARFSALVTIRICRRLLDEMRPMPHIRHALTWLRQKRCVVSHWPPDHIHPMLERLGVRQFFDTRDIESSTRLSRREMLAQIAHKRKVAPQDCIVVDHSPASIRDALSLGMRTIGFVGGADIEEYRGAQLAAAGASAIVGDMRHLKATITALRETAH